MSSLSLPSINDRMNLNHPSPKIKKKSKRKNTSVLIKEEERKIKLTPYEKLKYCVIGNFLVLLSVILLISLFATDTPYWRFGWNDTLTIISVKIDTSLKYVILFAVIAFINISKMVVAEVGWPILQFNIYNPDKDVITDFTELQLRFLGNSFFLINNLINLFMTLISISQFDVALWSLIVSEFAAIFTIGYLLSEKKFSPSDYSDIRTDVDEE